MKQDIPSPVPMFIFEDSILSPNTVNFDCGNITNLILGSNANTCSHRVNMDGRRVNNYAQLIDLCDMTSHTCFHYLTAYSFTAKKQSIGRTCPHNIKNILGITYVS